MKIGCHTYVKDQEICRAFKMADEFQKAIMNKEGFYISAVGYAKDEYKIVSFIQGVEKQSINQFPPKVYDRTNVDDKVNELYDLIWDKKFKKLYNDVPRKIHK